MTSCAANFLYFTINYSLLFSYHFISTLKKCRDVGKKLRKKFWIPSKRLKGQKAAATCDALTIHNDEVILLMKTNLFIQSRGADHGKCPLTSDPPRWVTPDCLLNGTDDTTANYSSISKDHEHLITLPLSGVGSLMFNP